MAVIFPTINDPGEFYYDSSNPTKYTEAASHAFHQVLYAMSQAGYVIDSQVTQVEVIRIDRKSEETEITLFPNLDVYESNPL